MTRLKQALIFASLMLLALTGTIRPASAAPPAQSGWAAVGFGAGYMRFDHLSAADGLSDQTVLTILQDQQGFLWFGTEEGLNRYDGYSFTTYQSDPNDPTSLSDSYITATIQDPDGSIWVGTYYGGLNRLNPRDGSFEHFQPDPADPNAIPAERVTALLMTSAGQLWVGTRAGLSRLDRETGQFITYQHTPGDPDSLKDDEILSLYEDAESRLWVGTRTGLDLFNPGSETFTHYLKNVGQTRAQAIAIIGDDGDKLWIGTPWGLLYMDPETGDYQAYTHDNDDPSSLSGNNITALHRDHLGALWIGIKDHGVNLVTDVTEQGLQVIAYAHRDYDANSLSSNSIRTIFEDNGGLMWFGTDGSGLSKANPDTRTFGFYQHEPDNPDSPAGDNITALAYDLPSHSLWIGTAESGLDRLDLVTGDFTHFRADPGNQVSLRSNRISLLHIGLNGELYVGTTSHPLQVYDPSVEGFLPALPESTGQAYIEAATAITHDDEGNLWISQESGRLLRLEPRSGAISTHYLRTGRYFYLANDRILSIHVDADGQLWLGTQSQGLVHFDPESEAFSIFEENGTPTGPSHNSITDIYEDEAGLLWLGTEGGGLNRFDPEIERFSYITAQNGLPSNRIFGIIPDAYGALWLSTGNGLAQLDPDSSAIRTFDTGDGLQGSEFNLNAYASGADSALFFGGVNGFNAFYPSAIRANDHVPAVVISSVSLFDRVLATNISGCDAELSLTHDQNFLSFEFAALDYAAPERNQFAYIMEGLNEDTVAAGTRRSADYPNLPPGRYTFRLFAANDDGVWNEDGACIHIEIQPPFYATWWFISLVGLFLGLSVVVGYRWRLLSIEQQRQQLALEVFERTEEIERRRQIASGLSDVIHLLNTNQPLDRSLDYIVKQAVGLTAASKAAIFERREDTVTARACYPAGETYAIDLTDPNSPSARSMLESTFLNRMLIYSRLDPKTLQPDSHWELVSGEYRTVFCMPLLVEDQVYGGLALYYNEERIFTQDEIALAQTLANQASLAITNERLKGEAQKAAVAAERNRLARDLHDAVTQTLFSTSLIAEVLPKIWEKDPAQGEARLAELKQLTRGALGEMRTLLMELRPSAFQDADPVELFKHLTDAFSGRTGVPAVVEISKDPNLSLPVEVKSVFYRVAQEGLNNIFKHADASKVWFRFDCSVTGVTLSISDDGQGFRQEDIPAGHMGLGIMAERAETIGADLTLVSQPGEGTTLRLVWQPDENLLK
ncbi:GAF domain-containing protein [bacterium]|nr:GAF domain-containing protein [bacterium]